MSLGAFLLFGGGIFIFFLWNLSWSFNLSVSLSNLYPCIIILILTTFIFSSFKLGEAIALDYYLQAFYFFMMLLNLTFLLYLISSFLK